ncbi:hypothetical protein PF002_g26846 [Phytophthora fragariae]|uniref:Uncharacterized protein n=1 Tax=Phytophthora fragariae TaxID=53985 RepID=A0A6A3DWD5_9STRA|nr:hypothetical protein PF009_g26949 [Phytophthora fragariae]KAE8973865.1 hypothetical protein PF011_g25085 [Phytophthora fragariae]KAE9182939.1 hypothetical protein PF002_g26846 [Phytophthora fragariae]
MQASCFIADADARDTIQREELDCASRASREAAWRMRTDCNNAPRRSWISRPKQSPSKSLAACAATVCWHQRRPKIHELTSARGRTFSP